MLQPTLINSYSLNVSHLSFSVGRKKLINDISFSLTEGKKVALVGLNGAGKSTLFKLLIGEILPFEGEVNFSFKNSSNQTVISSPCELDFKALMGYQASSMQALENITSREYLQLCCELKNIDSSAHNNSIQKVTKYWHLSEIINKPMQQLSQGNLQKLSIAQAFISQPPFLFLDEPTQTLDPLEQKRFIDNLNKLHFHQLCLFSSHHINETVAAADQVLMLHKGRLIAVLDIEAVDEFWFISNIKKEKINTCLISEQAVELICEKNKKLYRLNGGSQMLWEETSAKLKSLDANFKNLGSAAQCLMPLFAELANESF